MTTARRWWVSKSKDGRMFHIFNISEEDAKSLRRGIGEPFEVSSVKALRAEVLEEVKEVFKGLHLSESSEEWIDSELAKLAQAYSQ